MLRTVIGTVGNNVDDQLVQPPAGKKVLITVDMPVSIRNKAPYQIIRVHNGVTAILPAIYDNTLHTLTFEGDLFSVYSIVYTTPNSSGSSSSSSDSTSLDDKTITLVGDTRITPAIVIEKTQKTKLK